MWKQVNLGRVFRPVPVHGGGRWVEDEKGHLEPLPALENTEVFGSRFKGYKIKPIYLKKKKKGIPHKRGEISGKNNNI